jgi:hypothetical protein
MTDVASRACTKSARSSRERYLRPPLYIYLTLVMSDKSLFMLIYLYVYALYAARGETLASAD